MREIDTRGLSCPEPVIRTKKLISTMKPGEEAKIIVENGAARENVLRAINDLGCDVSIAVLEDDFCITITK